MLVLSRKADQRLLIGDDIEVVVVEVLGNRVKLGVIAPPHVRVLRDELRDKEPRRGQGDRDRDWS